MKKVPQNDNNAKKKTKTRTDNSSRKRKLSTHCTMYSKDAK